MNGEIGLDPFLPYSPQPKEGLAASMGGRYVISSAPDGYAYLEHSDDDTSPIRLFGGDEVRFYGSEVDLAAIADGDVLRILHIHRMEIIATFSIRPGTLFAPASGNSKHIGVVSPSGGAYLIDDRGNASRTSLNVRPEYSVLWSSTVRPVGYTWSDDQVASLYLKSTRHDDGATIATSHGMVVFTVWSNPSLRRHEAYLSTYDEQHILKRMYSTPTGAEVENVVEIDKGGVISDLITLSDGRPAVATGKVDGRVVSHLIRPSTSRSEYLKDVVMDPSHLSWVECVGSSSIITWTQTPITPEYPSIIDYGTTGHPKHRIIGCHPEDPVLPVTNSVKKISTSDKATVEYRYVSPLPDNDRYLANTVAIIVDEDGLVSAGGYSPTVRLCYEESVPVALLPVIGGTLGSARVDDVCMDILDVASDIVRTNTASEVVIVASGRFCESALMALKNKHAKIRNVVLVDPDPVLITGKRGRTIPKVVAVSPEPLSGYPTVSIESEPEARAFIQDYIR